MAAHRVGMSSRKKHKQDQDQQPTGAAGTGTPAMIPTLQLPQPVGLVFVEVCERTPQGSKVLSARAPYRAEFVFGRDVVDAVRAYLGREAENYSWRCTRIFWRPSPTADWQELPQDEAVATQLSDTYVVLLTPVALADMPEPRFIRQKDVILHRLRGKVDSPRFGLPDGSEFFSEFIAGAHVEDKTAFLPELLRQKWTFFLRPRRFGKSFWVSTLECFFSGAAEVFESFAVWQARIYEDTVLARTGDFVWNPTASRGHKFPPIPVLRLDFSQYARFQDADDVWAAFFEQLKEREEAEQLEHSTTFTTFITRLANHPNNQWQQVVVLIDEYDALLNKNIASEQRAVFENLRENFVKPFFTELKALDRYILFCFVTGTSAFGKTSVWSGANQFTDRSLDVELAAMCGFTHSEAKKIIERARLEESGPFEEVWQVLLDRYDGYRFSCDEKTEPVFNPYLIRRVVDKKKLVHGWTETATESVFKYVKRKALPCLPYDLRVSTLEHPDESPELDSDTKVVKMLFRAGYATIGAVHGDHVRLVHVNTETTVAVLKDYLRLEFNVEAKQLLLARLKDRLLAQDFVGFLHEMNRHMFVPMAEKASIGEADKERYFQVLVHVHASLCFEGTAVRCELEHANAIGYTDLTITYPDVGVVFEMKALRAKDTKRIWCSNLAPEDRRAELLARYQAAAETAHQQIHDRQYLFSRLMKDYADHQKIRVGLVADCRMRQLAYADIRRCGPDGNELSPHSEILVVGWADMFNVPDDSPGFESEEDEEVGMMLHQDENL